MFDDKLKEQLNELNIALLEREKNKQSKETMRKNLSKIGAFIKIDKMTPEEQLNFSKDRGMVGVDGSYTMFGNTYPNILVLAQALAKSTKTTTKEDMGIKDTKILTHILTNSTESEDDKTFSSSYFSKDIAKMEVEVAIKSIEKYNPFLVMFDGGFWRLNKDTEEEWENYKKKSIENSILSVGVIEDIGSYELWEYKEELELPYPSLDSELLFGLLDIGEIFAIKNRLFMNKFVKVFARFSNDPHPIACDFLPEQKSHIINILRLIYRLTPTDGRGIPIWLDIVDNEVKLTKEITDALIDTCIDTSLKHKLLTGKRNKR